MQGEDRKTSDLRIYKGRRKWARRKHRAFVPSYWIRITYRCHCVPVVPSGRKGHPPPRHGISVYTVLADHLGLCKDPQSARSFWQQKRLPWQFHITDSSFGQTEASGNRIPHGQREQERALPGNLHDFTNKVLLLHRTSVLCPTGYIWRVEL